MRPLGLYVHLPFCASKCGYCDFPSYAGQEAHREAYTQAVCAEITSRGAELGRPEADTVYLGGGTPSLMEVQQIAAILRALRTGFVLAQDAEITCEANPGTLKEGFLEALLEGGVNRLSLGAQSADAAELALLGRIHTWEAVEDSFRLARRAGLSNLSLDLMSGLPGQDWGTLRRSLSLALALKPRHLSCYSLILEEGTPLFARHARGEVVLPDEDSERALYWNTVRLLGEAGYPRYEISNFALPGFACRHNLNCWRYEDYLGFGASAAGLYRGVRRKNPDGLMDYLAGRPPEVVILRPDEERFEMLMLGLRTEEGLSLDAFARRFGLTVDEAWPEALARHRGDGLLAVEGGYLRLTPRGFDLMDRALVDFLPD